MPKAFLGQDVIMKGTNHNYDLMDCFVCLNKKPKEYKS